MKILKGLLSLLLCLCLIMPMGSAIVALTEGGIANMGSQTNSGSPTPAPSDTPAPSETDTPVETPDYAALYAALMAAETFAEAHALLEGLTDEQLDAFIGFLSEEQYAALEEHIDALIAAAEEDGDLEYVYTTVNFTNVAPLLDPVCGSPTRGASVSGDDTGSGNGNSGMVITKNAVANDDDDGTYTITLEAYATGSQIITEVTEDIPTDIVLVLDQSGSMADPIGTVSYSPYSINKSSNSEHYDRRHNGGSANLYYTLDEKAYFPVSVTVQEVLSYNPIDSNKNNSYYLDNKDNLYALVNGEYKKVKVTVSLEWFLIYTYTLPDGTEIGSGERPRGVPTFPGIDGNHLYLGNVDETQSVYTYTYTDSDGNIQTIGTSTGADTTFDTTLYDRKVDTNGGGSRLNALKAAVTTFADAVAAKAKGKDGTLGTDDDVNHRIAVVGFASGTYYGNTNYDYGNTEVLIGGSEYKYGTGANSVYASAFQDMSTTEGQGNITASINILDADGGTLTNLGMEMANGILGANPVPEGKKRNRVIIVFTDGAPGWSGYDGDVASSAITEASTAKGNGVTVYTVGIFSGADATTPGNKGGNDTEKANWFMQNLSSNNGAVQSPSYYLSAADADALNDIFKKISQQIETGGSSTNLSSATVIKDIIAPAFTLPEGATAKDITLETYACTGKDDNNKYTWRRNDDSMGATAAIDGDKVSVTGFDFAKYYVGTVTAANGDVSYRGHKLVISFKVSPKAGFLGGNNVYTNANAGVYENNTAITPVLTFERPQVNVPIKAVSVTASEKNVYLLNGLTAKQLKGGASVTVGGVSLDLSANNYGLEDWQMEYVDIRVVIKDSDGNEISSFENLSDDTTYSVTVTVSPKPEYTGFDKDDNPLPGTLATQQSGYDEGTINVFKPVLTFADSVVWYGGQYTANYESVAWKHGETIASSMEGSAPMLTLDYATTPENAIVEDYIVVPDDIPVNVSVKIGETAIEDHVSFVHDKCEHSGCDFGTEGAVPCKFILHVNTCSLTVNKAIAEGKLQDPEHQSFIFKVHYQGIQDGEGTILSSADYNVLIVGAGSRTIVGLPVGTYTVIEDTNWSWRYTLVGNNDVSAVLSAESSTATVTMTNRLNNELWLSDEAVAKNVFNSNSSPEYSPIPAIIPGKEDLTDEAD